ncbi:DUF1440 domain-containing protein [Flavilitoribacter nigricans]|uniref:DUF1440 domain-containing protein n=1 Tax=Flavilitoribacter nigricans (strain ATCC 23147 / DSM 23189 / NBRC 102662 / NCIMB 1420 / SS-2) TaxID=1122177 RepID=A0A2D0MWU5_FLAN2|nr:DUF1440 domain-containing protein [Flavilitoribacter nigricans]PHN00734.1 DUF1440 domain-containing protein [Flavilitoribacter nigricans DSM 23189 = NBRC 102662]
MPTIDARWKTILLAGLIAGTLDILAAIFILAGGHGGRVLRFIARGAIGDTAMEGGAGMALLGLVFHFFIATSFAAGYFVVYPRVPLLQRSVWLSGLFYGVFVWAVMQYLVLPLTYNAPAPFSLAGSWKAILILVIAVGLPIAWITHRYYRHHSVR